MPFLLLRTINLAGVTHRRGADITDIATPGEIESLRSGGFLADEGDAVDTPNEPIESQNEPVVSENDPIESPNGSDDSPVDPPKMFGLPAKVVKLLAEADPPILTEDAAMAYAVEHDDDFSAIKGIGGATSDDIVEAIKASLA